MEAIDVECTKCGSAIGVKCINSDGGILGYGGRTVKGYHPMRWDELALFVSAMENMGQGQLKAMLREVEATILAIDNKRAVTAVEAANKAMMLQSWRRRKGALWIRLEAENRPARQAYQRPTEKQDVPHPELIDCPKPGCNAKKGEKCHVDGYHLVRIRRSPLYFRFSFLLSCPCSCWCT